MAFGNSPTVGTLMPKANTTTELKTIAIKLAGIWNLTLRAIFG